MAEIAAATIGCYDLTMKLQDQLPGPNKIWLRPVLHWNFTQMTRGQASMRTAAGACSDAVEPRPPRLRARLLGGLSNGATSAFAALLAYLPNQALGTREGFWSAITAIAVVQTEVRATEVIARNQFTGAAIGGVVGLCLVLGLGQHLWIYVVAIILSMLICWVANVANASRLAGTTATIILLVPQTGSAQSMVVSRVSEVAWGVCVAVGTAWAIGRVSDFLLKPTLKS